MNVGYLEHVGRKNKRVHLKCAHPWFIIIFPLCVIHSFHSKVHQSSSISFKTNVLRRYIYVYIYKYNGAVKNRRVEIQNILVSFVKNLR